MYIFIALVCIFLFLMFYLFKYQMPKLIFKYKDFFTITSNDIEKEELTFLIQMSGIFENRIFKWFVLLTFSTIPRYKIAARKMFLASFLDFGPEYKIFRYDIAFNDISFHHIPLKDLLIVISYIHSRKKKNTFHRIKQSLHSCIRKHKNNPNVVELCRVVLNYLKRVIQLSNKTV
jgi:hypothetical protein